jgi:hypothetical protein
MVRQCENRQWGSLPTKLITALTLAAVVMPGPVLAEAQSDADFGTIYVSVALFRAAVLLAIGIVWFRFMRNASFATDEPRLDSRKDANTSASETEEASGGWTLRAPFGFQGSRP